LAARLADELTYVAGGKFRDQRSVRPALAYRFTSDSATEVALSYSQANYYALVFDPAQDRTGHAAALEANHYIFSDGKPLAAIGYAHVRNSSNGTDFDFKSDGLTARVTRPLWGGFSGEAGYSFTASSYPNPNSIMGIPRSDHVSTFILQALHPLGTQAQAFVRYNATRASSNIFFYTYRQNVISAGLEASF
jgi:hypothetical protein